MAAAYAAFANGGYYNEPYSFTKIVYADGETYINKNETRQVMSDSTAYMMTHMLQETANYGIDAGNFKNINGVKYAAKTGTTNFDTATFNKYKLKAGSVNDLWVVGYNTEYSIGLWYGYDKIQDGTNSLYGERGHQHQRIFSAVGKYVFTNKSDFKMPSSVVKVTTESNSATALLPSSNTPSDQKTTSLFVSGSEPNRVSTKFDKLASPSTVSANNNGDGTATVTWDKIETPDALNKTFITEIIKETSYPNGLINSYANHIYDNNISYLGDLGYSIYIEKNGVLELVGWTSNNSYTVSASNGNHKIVVKTSYQKYKGNMSDGVETEVNITGSSIFDNPFQPINPNIP
jgi:penicillin-binding protein 1A